MENRLIDTPYIHTLLKSIKGVPPGTAKKLENIGLKTAEDLLRHFPIRYEDWISPSPIEKFAIGQNVVIKAKVNKLSTKRIWQKKISITEAELQDNAGKIKAVWFNQPYIKYGFSAGDEIMASGKIMERQNNVILFNPAYEIVGKENNEKIGTIVPIYSRPKGISSAMIQKTIKKIIYLSDNLQEFLPETVLFSQKFPKISDCIYRAHFPLSVKEGMEAKKRFIFETFFMVQLLNRLNRQKLMEMKAPLISFNGDEVKSILSHLPFELTFSQKKSLFEILKDMSAGRPMNRLLQGDAGSGKTVVAAIAAIVAVKQGYQSAIMAPTEILAIQHYETIKKIFHFTGIKIGLLTANTAKIFIEKELESEIKKTDLRNMFSQNKINIIIGTHSLITEKNNSSMSSSNLGLAVIDEQHRFGIRQRASLIKNNSEIMPHFLSMSATPIPRTMAIALFGDLDVSFIGELPKNRKKIITKWVSPQNREKAYDFVKDNIKKGRQAFVVCPKIETSPENEEEVDFLNLSSWDSVKNVKKEYERLSSRVFPEINIGMLHGKMSGKEREKIMNDFKSGNISILVSTSVIEVGIDVPNATIMIIEDADRFGLAQLYQFRGRVGRGEHQSYCLLFSNASSEIAKNRLKALTEAKNGLELAEKDLILRGPGELLGDNQKGIPDITMKALQDKNLIESVKQAVDLVMNQGMRFEEFSHLKNKIDSLKEQFHLE